MVGPGESLFEDGLAQPRVLVVEFFEGFELLRAKGGNAFLLPEKLRKGFGKGIKRPCAAGEDFSVVDSLGVGGKLFLMLPQEEIEEMVLGFSRRGRGRGSLAGLSVMESACAQVLTPQGVELNGVHGGKGIIVNLDGISSELRIDPIETIVELNVAEVLVDSTGDLLHERGEARRHVHMTNDGEACFVALLGGLADLGVEALVIAPD